MDTITSVISIIGFFLLIYGIYLVRRISKTSIEIIEDNSGKDLLNEKENLANIRKENALIRFREKLKEEECISFPDLEIQIEALALHVTFIKNWVKLISFKDLSIPKSTREVFTEISYSSVPRRFSIAGLKEKGNLMSINELVGYNDKNVVILGQPGAGKTTTLKILANKQLEEKENQKTIILIRLRELNSEKKYNTISKRILQVLGGSIVDSVSYDLKSDFYKQVIAQLIEELNSLILLDGFDELSAEFREENLNEIRYLAAQLSHSKFVLTSRTGYFNEYIGNTDEFEIIPLNELQIKNFVNNWLNDQQKAQDLLKQIYNSPFFDASIRPLTLAHLCALYERYGIIPDKPRVVYGKIINLLLEEWDVQRSIVRSSSYSNFNTYEKFEFLSILSYHLTINLNKSIFSFEEIKLIYSKICYYFDLPKDEAKQVISEIESHTGIFVMTGYNSYEFAHKSIQEYLTSNFIVKLPKLPSIDIASKIPSELALAIALSSNPNIYFGTLVSKGFIDLFSSFEYTRIFLSRLIVEKPGFYPTILHGISIFKLYFICVLSIHLDDFIAVNQLFKKLINIPANSKSTILIRNLYREYNGNEILDLNFKAFGVSFKQNYFDRKIMSTLIESEGLIFYKRFSDVTEEYNNNSIPDFILLNKDFIDV